MSIIKKIYFFLILICLFLYGCLLENKPDNTINTIITAYNNGDIITLWDTILPKDKYSVASSMVSNIDNKDLFYIMSSYLNKDNISISNLSAEEYLYGSFRVILGDKDMELATLEKIDATTYQANIKVGEKSVIIPLKLLDDKWYMQIVK